METNNNNITDNSCINSSDFEEMRSQLEIMRRKLSRQDIVTDSLIRRTMSDRMSWIKRFVWFEILVVCPFIAIIFALFTYFAHLSWLPYIALMILSVVDVYFDYKVNVISQSEWHTGNLIATRRRLVKMNKWRMWQFVAGVAMAAVIFLWFAYEYKLHTDRYIVALIGGLIGGCMGLAISLMVVRKMQRTSNEIIREIEDITGEKEF